MFVRRPKRVYLKLDQILFSQISIGHGLTYRACRQRKEDLNGEKKLWKTIIMLMYDTKHRPEFNLSSTSW